ncbi:MAG: glutamate--tRNA ligase family protein, partial [Phycisphaerales bacterium]
ASAWRFVRRDVNHRMRMDPGSEPIDDAVAGAHGFDPAATDGDCIVWTKAGHPAYQLAVTVDDLAQGVTDVVRGDDLLPSAAIQARIHRALGGTPPRGWHLPLVLDAGGARMAKRRGSRSLSSLREAGATADRIRGLVLAWIGAREAPAPAGAAEFRDAVDVNILRAWHARSLRTPVVADDASLAWLRGP